MSVHEEKKILSVAGVILLLWMVLAAILLARRNYRLSIEQKIVVAEVA